MPQHSQPEEPLPSALPVNDGDSGGAGSGNQPAPVPPSPPLPPAATDIQEALRQRTLWESVIQRVQTDASFRAELIANPAQVLQREGISLLPGVEITVIELDPKRPVILLPPLKKTNDSNH